MAPDDLRCRRGRSVTTKVPEQHAESLGLHRLRVESSNPTVPTIASSSPKFEWTTSPCLLGEIRATAGRAMALLVLHSYRNALVRGVAFKCGQAILSYQRVEAVRKLLRRGFVHGHPP